MSRLFLLDVISCFGVLTSNPQAAAWINYYHTLRDKEERDEQYKIAKAKGYIIFEGSTINK